MSLLSVRLGLFFDVMIRSDGRFFWRREYIPRRLGFWFCCVVGPCIVACESWQSSGLSGVGE